MPTGESLPLDPARLAIPAERSELANQDVGDGDDRARMAQDLGATIPSSVTPCPSGCHAAVERVHDGGLAVADPKDAGALRQGIKCAGWKSRRHSQDGSGPGRSRPPRGCTDWASCAGAGMLHASRPCEQPERVCAMVAARVLAPHTKLATTRWWHTTTLGRGIRSGGS